MIAGYQDDGDESIGEVLRLYRHADDVAIALQFHCAIGHDAAPLNGEQGCGPPIGREHHDLRHLADPVTYLVGYQFQPVALWPAPARPPPGFADPELGAAGEAVASSILAFNPQPIHTSCGGLEGNSCPAFFIGAEAPPGDFQAFLFPALIIPFTVPLDEIKGIAESDLTLGLSFGINCPHIESYLLTRSSHAPLWPQTDVEAALIDGEGSGSAHRWLAGGGHRRFQSEELAVGH